MRKLHTVEGESGPRSRLLSDMSWPPIPRTGAFCCARSPDLAPAVPVPQLLARPTAMAATTEPVAGIRQLSCQVNGEPIQLDLPDDDGLTLLDVLRDFLGITSPKNGCQPQAQCGCCTVLMDGKPVLACALAPAKAEGKSITTLEGLDDEHRQQIADSFVRCGGVQCGFCIPGMAMRGVGLCDKNPSPSRDEIANALKPHLCRCTGYAQIVDSIEQYAKLRRGETLPEPSAADKSGHVGTDLPRYTGHDAVLGDRKFIDDMTVPSMLFGAVRLTDHPRAKVLRDRRLPAALAIAGRPSRRHRGRCAGRPLRRPDRKRLARVRRDRRRNPLHRRHDRRRRGRHPAARPQGSRADRHQIRSARAGDRSARRLEPVRRSCTPNAAPTPQQIDRSSGVTSKKASAASAHVIEDTYHTQRIEHLFLEPEACIAIPTGDAGCRMRGAGNNRLCIPHHRILPPCPLHLHPRPRRLRRPAAMRLGARRRPRPRPDRARQQRRRVRRQRRHVDPGPNRADGLARRPPRENDAHPARELPASIRSGTRSSSATRSAAMPKAASRPSRPASSATRVPMPRSARRCSNAPAATHRALSRAEHRHGIARRLHEQPALRRDARLRREPGRVRHRRPARSAGRESRHRRLRHPRAQHPRSAAKPSPRARSSTSRSASAKRSKR